MDATVGSLSAGERQKTEILKQLYLQRRFLVLDEPTSVLTPQEADEMLGLMQGLAHERRGDRGDHHPQAVRRDALHRRGHRAAPRPAGGAGRTAALTPGDMTAMMIGEPHAPAAPGASRRMAEAAVRLSVPGCGPRRMSAARGWTSPALEVRAHEIVGVAGVSGNGQKELLEVLGGQRPADRGRGHGRRRRLPRHPPAIAGAARAGAAGGAAAQRLRADDVGGGQPQSAPVRRRRQGVAPWLHPATMRAAPSA